MKAMDPSPLRSYPDPDSVDSRRPPFPVHLTAWAEGHAKRLHELFGGEVRLTVGVLLFPERRDPRPVTPPTPVGVDDRLRVATAAQLRVRPGHDLHASVTLANLSLGVVELRRQGRVPALTGVVADPDNGKVVSAHYGFSTLVGGLFALQPGEELELPLTVYTDSATAALGYAVPAGSWDVRALILRPDQSFSYSNSLALTII